MNILSALRTDWTNTATRRTARHQCHEWATAHPCLARFGDPAQIVSALRTRPVDTDEILNAVLVEARTSQLARRTLLEAFLPAVAHRLARTSHIWSVGDDLLGEYLAALQHGIIRVATIAPVDYPATRILRSVHAFDSRTAYWAARPSRERAVGLHGELLAANELDHALARCANRAPSDTPERATAADQLLATLVDAVRDGLVTPGNASDLARTVFTRETTSDQARRNFIGPRAMQLRLQTITHNLAAA